MFDRPHHRRIASVLEALDAPLLRACHCFFGGGTAIALSFGEYRESIDIDFMVSELAGYRDLRQRMTGAEGIQAIAGAGHRLVFPRPRCCGRRRPRRPKPTATASMPTCARR